MEVIPGGGGTVPALLSYSHRTLSRRPRFSRHKLYMEGDPFEFELRITNDGDEPFPDSPMVVSARWLFQSGDAEERQLLLAPRELAPGASKGEKGTIELESAGYTHLYVSYAPHDHANGETLHDANGREIGPSGKVPLTCFRGSSVMELLSFWAIILASASAAISATALVITLMAFMHL